MPGLPFQRRTIGLLAVAVPLLVLFVFVILRSGPLAPVKVTTTRVQQQSITPDIFGIGTIQARSSYKIGPVMAGKLQQLTVDVGDVVSKGQVIGQMDPVDLDERLKAQHAAIEAAAAALTQAEASLRYAQSQAGRYEQLLQVRGTSEEVIAAKRQELAVANAALLVAQQNLHRLQAEQNALVAQKNYLQLVAPHNGIVTKRELEPGSVVVAGQSIIEIIDPDSLWVDTRFDQISAQGLAAGLLARVTLRSRATEVMPGIVGRVEPVADSITEETIAKITFSALPSPLPPLGELAEVTVTLPALQAEPTIPNAALRLVNGHRGVWLLQNGRQRFVPLTLGRSDLAGNIQVPEGLQSGDEIVLYSEKSLTENSRLTIVSQLAGAEQ